MPNKQMSQAVKQTKHGKAAHYYLQAAQTCPPRDKGRTTRDVQPFVEAVWHFCQAEQWQAAYKLMDDQWLFRDLSRWGRNEQLLEINQNLEVGIAQLTRLQVAHIYNELGSVYDDLGNKQEALRYFGEALSIPKEVGDRGGEGTTLNNLGKVYDDLGNKQEALRYYGEALSIMREVRDRGREGATLNNLGKVYNALGDTQEALRYYGEALSIRREVGDRGGEGATLNNLGSVYNALGNKPEALRYFGEALSILREVGDRGGEGGMLHNIGMLFFEQHNYRASLASILLAKTLYEQVESPSDVEDEVRLLDDLCQALGEKEYADLLKSVEPQVQLIVDEALRDVG